MTAYAKISQDEQRLMTERDWLMEDIANGTASADAQTRLALIECQLSSIRRTQLN